MIRPAGPWNTNERTEVMKRLFLFFLPTIISKVLQARKAKQAGRAGQAARPPRNRF